jgi:ABC-type transporter Mla maintaining outer membrane lipid asymmetry ATPase subunit MlaF
VTDEILRHRTAEDSVAVYHDKWRVVVESTGDRWAFKNGDSVPFEGAPSELRKTAEQHLQRLVSDTRDQPLATEQERQLESLGYL